MIVTKTALLCLRQDEFLPCALSWGFGRQRSILKRPSLCSAPNALIGASQLPKRLANYNLNDFGGFIFNIDR